MVNNTSTNTEIQYRYFDCPNNNKLISKVTTIFWALVQNDNVTMRKPRLKKKEKTFFYTFLLIGIFFEKCNDE